METKRWSSAEFFGSSLYLLEPSDLVRGGERIHSEGPLAVRQTEVGVVERLKGCVENH